MFHLIERYRHWDCIYFDSPVLDRNHGRNGSKNREEATWKRSNGFPPRQERARVLCFREKFESTRVQFPRWVTATNDVTKARTSATSSASLDRNCEWNIVESLIVHDVVNDDVDDD